MGHGLDCLYVTGRFAKAADLGVPIASNKVVVDHSGRLHECIADGGADEGKAAPSQVLTEQERLGR